MEGTGSSFAALAIIVLAGCAATDVTDDTARVDQPTQVQIHQVGSDGSLLQISVTLHHYHDHRHPGKSAPGGAYRQGVPPEGLLHKLAKVVLQLREHAGTEYTGGDPVDRGLHFTVHFRRREPIRFRLRPGFYDDAESRRLHDQLWRMLNSMSASKEGA